MKILHLATWSSGGAANAASRLSEALRYLGHDSQILHMSSRLPAYIDAAIGKLTKVENPIFHSYNYFGEDISKKIKDFAPDLIHIHWIGAGFVRPESLMDIQVPIVWTLHDLWPLCGAEHLPGLMSRFTDGYLKNNRPANERGLDLERYVYERKVRVSEKIKITYIAPSHYVQDLASNSAILHGTRPHYIPNGIDLKLYNFAKARPEKISILFCTSNQLNDPLKGFDLLLLSLKLMPNEIKDKISVVVVGADKPTVDPISSVGIKSDYLGVIKNKEKLVEIYKRSSLTVVPSRIETLSFVTMESLACGTPVVAFNYGGIPDLVKHNQNGYLAKPYDVRDLAKGIIKISSNQSLARQYGKTGRETIQKDFDIAKIARKHLVLYKKLIKEHDQEVIL